MEVEMKIRGLMMDPVTNMPIVVLKDANGSAVLPIWVGVGGTPTSFVRAGMLGLPLMVAIIGGEPHRFRPLIDLYRKAGLRAGHSAEKLTVGLHSIGFLGDTTRQAADDFYTGYAHTFTEIGKERGSPLTTRAQFDAVRGPTGALLIGDAAIDAQLSLPVEHVYDLGTLWHDWTGEQTVFAVWVARREVYEQNAEDVRACMHALTDSYTWARGNMGTVIERAQQIIARPPGFYENYYAKLNFTFHSAAQRGLAAYCRELQAIGAIETMPRILPEAIGVGS